MTLRETIKTKFNIDLAIDGGFGFTIEDAILILKTNPETDYINIENEVVKYSITMKHELIGRNTIITKWRKIDVLELKAIVEENDFLIEQMFQLYFDITSFPTEDEQTQRHKKFKSRIDLNRFMQKGINKN